MYCCFILVEEIEELDIEQLEGVGGGAGASSQCLP